MSEPHAMNVHVDGAMVGNVALGFTTFECPDPECNLYLYLEMPVTFGKVRQRMKEHLKGDRSVELKMEHV